MISKQQRASSWIYLRIVLAIIISYYYITYVKQTHLNFDDLTFSVKLQPPLFSQYKGCSQHQSLVSGFSCILQVITICCPGALIWNPVLMTTSKPGSCNEQSKRHVPGSALDKLALSPSELPLPSSFTSPVIRKQVTLYVCLLSVLLDSEVCLQIFVWVLCRCISLCRLAVV